MAVSADRSYQAAQDRRLGLARQSRVPRRPNPLATTGMMFFAFIIIGGIDTRPINTPSQYVIVIFSYVIVVTFTLRPRPQHRPVISAPQQLRFGLRAETAAALA